MASPVVADWMNHRVLVNRAELGQILVVTDAGTLSRKDLVGNSEALIPILKHMGLRPSIDLISLQLDMFFYWARPRGRPNVPRPFAALAMLFLFSVQFESVKAYSSS